MKRNKCGFALIELMIVVAIVGILSAIAIPSYQQHVRKARRADARTVLLEDAQFMQRFYSQNDNYRYVNDGEKKTEIKLPAPLTVVPRGASESAKYYDVSIDPDHLSERGFELRAIPTGVMEGDPCGTLTINNVGQRGVEDAAPGETINSCWN